MPEIDRDVAAASARLTWPHFLEDVATRFGERTALRSGDDSWSYADLLSGARRVAKGLIAAGVGKGARVGVWMANRPEWVTAAFGASMTGAVVVPVNTFATADERDYILRHGDVSTLLLQRELAGHAFLEELLAGHPGLRSTGPRGLRSEALPQLRRIYCLGLEEGRGAVESWARLQERGAGESDALLDACIAEVTPADEGVVIYTSGTTARPKGVIHRQRSAVLQSWRFAELMGLASTDVVYTAQPFFWTAGIAMSLGATLAAGATLVVDPTFDPERALRRIEGERVTTLHAWPHQEKSMAEHPAAAECDLSSLRHLEFGSPLAARVPLTEDTWGIHGSYGLSETFTLATALPADAPAELRHTTNGPPLPGNEVRILDPITGSRLPAGEKGEIAVRGPTLMIGYAKVDPEQVFDADGFFHTQDAGWLDADGRLHWKGRLSHVIKTGGANVSPLEIEGALADYPGLEAAHAVGVPHPTLGEAIVLCTVATGDGMALEEEAIRIHLKARLASYKLPRFVLPLAPEEVPYTGTQKVQPQPLREKALAALEAAHIEIAGHTYGT